MNVFNLKQILLPSTIIALLFGYLLGSIPFALVIGKIFYKTDIRTKGSGNLGGSNAGRVLGKKAGIAVVLLDVLKSFIAMFICNLLFKSHLLTLFSGLACCIGHCFPVFARFKGGKAVATAMGFYFGVCLLILNNFTLFLSTVIVFFILLYLSKMVSLSSIIATLYSSVYIFLYTKSFELFTVFFILWIFITYRHKENIKRIINKEEKKITWM